MSRMVYLAALAGTVVAAPAAAQQQEAATAVSPVTDAAFAGTSAITEGDLGKIAGREDRGTMIAAADQRNTVSNNSVVGTSQTGTITIDGNAFQNLQGLAVISANSGNNVAINSAMNVTINMAPQ